MSGPTRTPSKLAPLLRVTIDPNAAMGSVNESFDRVLSIMKTKNALDRHDALRDYDDRIRQRYKKLSGQLDTNWGQVKSVLMGRIARRRTLSDLFGKMMLGSYLHDLEIVRLTSRTTTDLLLTGLALAEYRARRGEYPERLEALAPDYLDAVPTDRFLPTPTPLTYRRHEDGFSLYSVGKNGVDDGGRPDDPSQEDIELLVNPPKPEEG